MVMIKVQRDNRQEKTTNYALVTSNHATYNGKNNALIAGSRPIQCLFERYSVYFTQIYPSLISTFSDTNESPELRMAIFQLLLNSEPDVTTLQSVTNIVRQEITNQDPGPRSNQVASYVISLLSSVASNDNPVMKKRQ